jgi:DNA-binding transcriptional ArsR family regulator
MFFFNDGYLAEFLQNNHGTTVAVVIAIQSRLDKELDVSSRKIAADLSISPSSANQHIKILEDQGYVTRTKIDGSPYLKYCVHKLIMGHWTDYSEKLDSALAQSKKPPKKSIFKRIAALIALFFKLF